jgi:hypothetical protein
MASSLAANEFHVLLRVPVNNMSHLDRPECDASWLADTQIIYIASEWLQKLAHKGMNDYQYSCKTVETLRYFKIILSFFLSF